MSRICILATNAKGGELTGDPLAKWIRSQKDPGVPLVSSVTEAMGPPNTPFRIQTNLRKTAPSAKFYTGENGYARETATLTVGNAWHNKRHETISLCGPGPTGRGGQDQPRYAQVNHLIAREHRVNFITVHAPLGTHNDKGDWRTADQADRWKGGMIHLELLVEAGREKGFLPVLSGDFNEFASKSQDGLEHWARQHRMQAFSTRVMWILLDNKFKVLSWDSIPVPNNISDHPAFLRVMAS